MMILRAFVMGLLLLGLSQSAQAGSNPTQASLTWLSWVDSGKYDESWSHSSTLLRLQQLPDEWLARMKRLQAAYGAFSMRSVTGVSFSRSVQGLPDGSYATVRFQSSFFRQRNATETVTLRFETDKWRVVSYTLR